MIKYLSTLLVTILLTGSFFSCTKEKDKQCYECDMMRTNGETYKDYPCTDDIEKWAREAKDQNGNPLASDCRPR